MSVCKYKVSIHTASRVANFVALGLGFKVRVRFRIRAGLGLWLVGLGPGLGLGLASQASRVCYTHS